MIKPVFAVCAIIKDSNDKILSVSRNDNYEDLGLPGGKVEPDEDPKEAIKREVKEETGLTLTNFIEVYDGICGGDRVITYLALEWEGAVGTEEGHEVKWADPKELLTESCTFQKYNMLLFNSIASRVNSKISSSTISRVRNICWVTGIIAAMFLFTFWQYVFIGTMLAIADTIRSKAVFEKNKWMLQDIINNNEHLKDQNINVEDSLFSILLIGKLFTIVPFWLGELLFILLKSVFSPLDTEDLILHKFKREGDDETL